MSWLSGIVNIFTGSGVASSLLRTVSIGYLLNKVSSSATKGNDSKNGRAATKQSFAGIDNGVRLQVPPAADEKNFN